MFCVPFQISMDQREKAMQFLSLWYLCEWDFNRYVVCWKWIKTKQLNCILEIKNIWIEWERDRSPFYLKQNDVNHIVRYDSRRKTCTARCPSKIWTKPTNISTILVNETWFHLIILNVKQVNVAFRCCYFACCYFDSIMKDSFIWETIKYGSRQCGNKVNQFVIITTLLYIYIYWHFNQPTIHWPFV